MPRHSVHRKICKFILGKEYPEVDRALDLPYVILGKRHRLAFHDPVSAWIVGSLVAGEEGGYAALIHIWLDQICKDKNFEKLLKEAFK